MHSFTAISRLISTVFPPFSGAIFSLGLSPAWPARELLLAYAVFLMLFFAWVSLQQLVLRIGIGRPRPGTGSGYSVQHLLRLATYLVAFVLFVFTLASLHYVRERFSPTYLYLLLTVLAAASLRQFFMQKSFFVPALLSCLAYYGATVFCSYYFFSGQLNWQALIFSIACAAIFCNLDLIKLLWDSGLATRLADWRARIYAILSCLGPALVVGLSIYQQLPQRFILMVALIPLGVPLTARLKALDRQAKPDAALQREATGICALFFVMLGLLLII